MNYIDKQLDQLWGNLDDVEDIYEELKILRYRNQILVDALDIRIDELLKGGKDND